MAFTFTNWKGVLISFAIAMGIGALIFTIQILLATIRKISWWKNYLGYFCIWVGTGVCCAFFQPIISIICWIAIFLTVVCVCEIKVRKENRKFSETLKNMHGRKRECASKKLPLRLNVANFVLTAISSGIWLIFSVWNRVASTEIHFVAISLWIACVFAGLWFYFQYWGSSSTRNFIVPFKSLAVFQWNGSPICQEGDARQTMQKWIHAVLWFVLSLIIFVQFLIFS